MTAVPGAAWECVIPPDCGGPSGRQAMQVFLQQGGSHLGRAAHQGQARVSLGRANAPCGNQISALTPLEHKLLGQPARFSEQSLERCPSSCPQLPQEKDSVARRQGTLEVRAVGAGQLPPTGAERTVLLHGKTDTQPTWEKEQEHVFSPETGHKMPTIYRNSG